MKKVNRKVEVDVELTPAEVADIIWSMNSDDQVVMLNHLAEISGNMNCFQLQYITDNDDLTIAARVLMSQIGNYAERSK